MHVVAWGMTELSPLATVSKADNAVIGSCGVLLSNTEAKIVDLETGKSLGPNQRGELCIRGPQVKQKSKHLTARQQSMK